MIEEILPASVAAVEAFGDLPDAELFPAEDADIGPAIHTRRREFATGRACARAALACARAWHHASRLGYGSGCRYFSSVATIPAW